jgi:hypothetical protein
LTAARRLVQLELAASAAAKPRRPKDLQNETPNNEEKIAPLDQGRCLLKTMARDKTKTTVIARKLKRTLRATQQKAVSLGVKLGQRVRKA